MSKTKAPQKTIVVTYPADLAWHLHILQAHAAMMSIQWGRPVTPEMLAGMVLTDWVKETLSEGPAFEYETAETWGARRRRIAHPIGG